MKREAAIKRLTRRQKLTLIGTGKRSPGEFSQQIPNIGPSIAANLRLIGVLTPHDLLGKAGEPAKPCWKYTPERKRTLAARPKGNEIPAAK